MEIRKHKNLNPKKLMKLLKLPQKFTQCSLGSNHFVSAPCFFSVFAFIIVDGIQDLTLPRQALPLSYIPSFFLIVLEKKNFLISLKSFLSSWRRHMVTKNIRDKKNSVVQYTQPYFLLRC